MMNVNNSVLTAILAVSGVACGPFVDIGAGGEGRANLETAQEIEVQAEARLNLANTFGDITVLGDASRAEVLVEPTMRSDDPEAGYIEVLRDGDDIAVAIFQEDMDAEIAVDLVITTPANLGFTVATGGGALTISGMVAAADCEAATGDGQVSIDIDLDGHDLDVANGQGSGDISLAIPASTAAELTAASYAGSVEVDAALNPDGEGYGGTFSGSLNGGGGSEINLASASGRVVVHAR